MPYPHLFADSLGDDVLITTADDIVVITLHETNSTQMKRGIELNVVNGKIVVARDDRPNRDGELLSLFEDLFS